MSDSIIDLLQMPNEMYDNQMVPGFVQGTVVENNNNKYPGMVKVSFTVWEQGKNMIEWVRLLSPYTGKDYGSYMVPEINETVLVGFIGGSLKKPFLLGSLYPKDSKFVKQQFDKKNKNKVLRTKGGTEIAIDDTNGKDSISVVTPKETKFVIEDAKETILMSDKEGKNKVFLDLKKGEIMICADKKITLKTGTASVVMTGTQGDIKIAGNKVGVNAKQTLNMEGKTSATLKGASLTAQGMQSATLKATGQTTVSGAMVKIN
ncbi:MAG: hypothetical protein IJN54_05620 [Lachnospiraceae bacterium]|nr:hypothetical protein [Lachnospiraceae bacterium]